MDSEIIGALITAIATIFTAAIGGWVAIKIKDMELKAKERETGQILTQSEKQTAYWLWGIGGAAIVVIVILGGLVIVGSLLQPSNPIPIATVVVSTPIPTSIPTPAIPLYDDFENGVIDETWYDPKWEGTQAIDFEVTESDGALRFSALNDTSSYRLGKLLTGKNQILQELYMFVTVEEITRDGSFGLFVNSSGGDWFNLFIQKNKIALNSKRQSEKTIQTIQCCPSTHLLGAKVDKAEVNFYVDGELVATLPKNGNLENPGFEISTSNGMLKAYVDKVWIRFAE